MKKISRMVLTIIYVIFSYFYALEPEFGFNDGFAVKWNTFDLETYIMMLFIGLYLVCFWRGINKLFRN